MISFRDSINYIRVCNNNISQTMSIYELYNIVTSALFPTQQQANHSQNMESEESEGMTTIARINRLALLLAQSVYQRKYQDNICLFYSSLILEYPRAKATKIRPSFLHSPSIYTPLINFNISLGVRVQSKKINCELDLSIMFPSDLSHQMPHFYIKNPNYELFKPVQKFTKIVSQNQNYPYEAIFGGLRVVLPLHSQQRWNWTPSLYYRQQNIVNIVRFIHKRLLPDFFPFAKRKLQKNNAINEKAKTVKQLIEQQMVPNSEQVIPLLQNIQSTHALHTGIQNEISALKIQLQGLKEYIEESQSFDIQKCLPKPTDHKSQIILDIICSIQALKDTEWLLQEKFTCEQINFNQFKTFVSLTSNQKFQKMTLLKQLENMK